MKLSLPNIVLVAGLWAGMALPVYALDADCPDLLYHHGYASGAQFHCGYEFYNQSVIDRAAECRAQAVEEDVEEELMNILRMGVDDFNTGYDSTSSKHRFCAMVADEYSDFVAP